MEKFAISRLIGAPPGYVGYDEGGQLTEAVRRRPYAVVLFDEIEKAHPEVFNILLQILDDGHITDAQGRQVDFKSTIIIMTSNIGSQAIAEYNGGEGYERIRSTVSGELRNYFRPEFLNRIDEIVIFHALSREHIRGIVAIQLDRFKERLKAVNVEMVISDQALEYLANKGFDPVYGARPLKRLIAKELESPLSRLLISGEAREGSSVGVDVNDEALSFSAAA
jgi:ATP-dependent Clp protease ATP-binding subunit ClpB